MAKIELSAAVTIKEITGADTVPTIPTVEFGEVGWLETDLLDRQLCINTSTNKLYVRTGNVIGNINFSDIDPPVINSITPEYVYFNTGLQDVTISGLNLTKVNEVYEVINQAMTPLNIPVSNFEIVNDNTLKFKVDTSFVGEYEKIIFVLKYNASSYLNTPTDTFEIDPAYIIDVVSLDESLQERTNFISGAQKLRLKFAGYSDEMIPYQITIIDTATGEESPDYEKVAPDAFSQDGAYVTYDSVNIYPALLDKEVKFKFASNAGFNMYFTKTLNSV